MIKKLLWLFLLLLFTIPLSARDFTYTYEGQTLTYTVLDEEAKTCMTTAGYNYSDDYWAAGNDVSGDLVIPAIAKVGDTEYTVTSLGNYAFYNCSGLTSVTIPNSVKSIGGDAFWNCSGLTKAEFASVESLCSIKFSYSGSNPLSYAHHLYINGKEITELTIPESVTSIGQSAFQGCNGLTSVTIPESVTSIGEYAFYKCSGLTSVTIPNSVESIGDLAFNGCSGLTSVTIPESVTSIGGWAFKNCHCLTSIVSLGEIAPYIQQSSFEGLYDQAEVIVPDNSLNSYLSSYWSLFSNLRCAGGFVPETFDDGLYNYKVSGENSAVLISGDYKNMTSVSVPDRVVYNDKFYFVNYIGSAAFKDCNNIETLVLPKNLEGIGNSAFCGCSGITSVTIPESVTSIGEDAFQGCNGMTKAEFASIESLCSLEFDGYNSNPLSYANHLYIDGTEITELTIPESVTSIGKYAFDGCSGLTSVTIPESVTSIGNNAFRGCSGLTKAEFASIESLCSIEFGERDSNPLYYAHHLYINGTEITELIIPESVTSIGDEAFSNCRGLTSVTIGNSVKSIGNYAFYNCSDLTSVTIPNSVQSIGKDAFYRCSGLTKAEFPTIESLCSIKFDGYYSNPLSNAHHLYISGIEITELTIPESVTSVGSYAFAGCSGLTSVEIPNSVIEIWDNPFYKCSNLKTVIVPKSVQSIYPKSFGNTDNETTVFLLNPETQVQVQNSDQNNSTLVFYADGNALENLKQNQCWMPNAKFLQLPTGILNKSEMVLIGPSDTTEVEFNLAVAPANGFQFDMTLPAGLILDNPTSNEENLKLNFSKLQNGDYRVIGYTADNSEITSDYTLGMNLTADETLERGSISIHDALLSVSENEIPCDDCEILVTGYSLNINLPDTMVEGETISLPVAPENATYTWSVDNPSVATIIDGSSLKAKNEGVVEVMLSLTDSGISKNFSYMVEVLAALWGDADGNNSVDVADLVAIVNYILERNPENFNTHLADIDRNGRINIVDLTSLVKIILTGTSNDNSTFAAIRRATAFGDEKTAADRILTVPVEIDADSGYSAMQGEIILPEGLSLERITLGNGMKDHILDYAMINSTTARFVIYSASLASMGDEDNKASINLLIKGTPMPGDQITLTNAMTCDANCRPEKIDDAHIPFEFTTSIDELEIEKTADIYSLQGVCIMRNASADDIRALPSGIYIINGKKVFKR